MMNASICSRICLLALPACVLGTPAAVQAQGKDQTKAAAAEKRLSPSHKQPLDRSGKARKGKASYYGPGFAGKTMADGTPMNPHAAIAASRTLPLGTKARVTNLENGKSSVVEIKDRGPYVDGRIVDLSPKIAQQLGMKEQGVAPVEVAPIAVPQVDGSMKPGAGALDSEIAASTQ